MKLAIPHNVLALSIAAVMSLGGLTARAQIQPEPITLGRTATNNLEVFFVLELAEDATSVTFTLTPEPLTSDRKHYPIIFISWGDLHGPNRKKQQMINLAYDMEFTLPVETFQNVSGSKFLYICGEKGIWSLKANNQKIKAAYLREASSLRALELNDNLLGKSDQYIRLQGLRTPPFLRTSGSSSLSADLGTESNLEFPIDYDVYPNNRILSSLKVLSLNRNYFQSVLGLPSSLRVLELSGNRLMSFNYGNPLAALDLSLNLLQNRTNSTTYLSLPINNWVPGTSTPNGPLELIYSRRGTEATMSTMRDDVTYQSRYLDLSHNRLTLKDIPPKPANLPATHYLVSYQERFRLPYLSTLGDDGQTGMLPVGSSITLSDKHLNFQGIASSSRPTTIKWYVENDASTDDYTEVNSSFYTVSNGTVTFHKHPTGDINSKFFAVSIPADGTLPTQIEPTAKRRATGPMWSVGDLEDYRFQSYERTNTPNVEAYDPITHPLERMLNQPAGNATTITLVSGELLSSTGASVTGDGTARTGEARFYRSNVIMLDPYANNYWHGTVSNEWQDPRNWTNHAVPISTKDEYLALTPARRATRSKVEFATVANNNNNPAIRDLELDQDRYIYDYVNRSERYKSISVPPGKTLFHENTRTFAVTSNRLRLRAAKDKPNGAYKYIGESYKRFNNALPEAEIELYAKGDNANLTLSQTKWQYFSVPLKTNANQVALGDNDNATVMVRSYHRLLTGQYDNKWLPVPDNTILGSPEPHTKAYQISQAKPATYRFFGTLYLTDATFSAYGTASPNVYDNMNLFGNPYVAAMPIKDLVFPNSGVDKVVYLFNTGSREQWLAGAGGTTPNSIPGSYTAGIPQGLSGHLPSMPKTIPSLSTFMVKASGNANITFPYSALVGNTEANRARLAPEAEPNITSLTIDLATDSVTYDRLWLVTAEGTTANYDNGYDAEKFIAGNIAQLYAMGQKNYQVLAADNVHDTRIAVTPGAEKRELSLRFTIERPEFNIHTYYVDDHVTGQTFIAKDGDVYKFTAKPTDTLHRFTVRTKHITGMVPAQTAIEIVAIGDRTIEVRNNTDKEATAKLYDVKGVLLETLIIAAGEKVKASVDMPGFYIVNATNGTTAADARFLLK